MRDTTAMKIMVRDVAESIEFPRTHLPGIRVSTCESEDSVARLTRSTMSPVSFAGLSSRFRWKVKAASVDDRRNAARSVAITLMRRTESLQRSGSASCSLSRYSRNRVRTPCVSRSSYVTSERYTGCRERERTMP